MKLNRPVLAFQSSQSLTNLLVTGFVTLFLLQGEKGLTDVALGSLIIALGVVFGFFLINILSQYYQLKINHPILLSGIMATLIGIGLFILPQYAWVYYGLYGLSTGLYYSGVNLVMIQDISSDSRGYHIGVMQSLGGLIGVGVPLIMAFFFKGYGSEFTYSLVFVLIALSGSLTIYAASLHKSEGLITYHSFMSIRRELPKIERTYLLMIGCMGAGFLKSQIDVIIPHTINLSEVDISYIIAGLKLCSLLMVFFSGKFLQARLYGRMMIITLITLMLGGGLFIYSYTPTMYVLFAITTVLGSTLFAFAYTVVSSKRIEVMNADNRAINLVGECVMALVRVVIALIMLQASVGVMLGKVVLLSFLVCFFIGGIIAIRKSSILVK